MSKAQTTSILQNQVTFNGAMLNLYPLKHLAQSAF